MNSLIVITGQTGTGKTRLACNLAKERNGEIINADSRQIYTGLDIVTNKTSDEFVFTETKNEFVYRTKNEAIPLWCFNIANPNIPFSSYEWTLKAKQAIEDIWSRGKTPIIVGGTYFYLKHLLYGLDETAPPNNSLRRELQGKSAKELQNILENLDVKKLAQLNESDKQNPHRLMRKIELAQFAKEHSELRRDVGLLQEFPDIDLTFIGSRFENKDKTLIQIRKGIEARLKLGAIEEVKRLLTSGCSLQTPGLQTIGYQELIPYILGMYSLEEAKRLWEISEIKYCKRQLTFMKKDVQIKWELA